MILDAVQKVVTVPAVEQIGSLLEPQPDVGAGEIHVVVARAAANHVVAEVAEEAIIVARPAIDDIVAVTGVGDVLVACAALEHIVARAGLSVMGESR